MHLSNTSTCSSSALHDTPTISQRSVVKVKTNAKNLFDFFTKVLPDDAPDLIPGVLRRIVKHARKHLLELGRQDGTLHGNGLTDLEVQAAIVAQQMEQALRVAVMHVGQRVGKGWVRTEVDLVVEGGQQASGKCARAARQHRVEEVDVA